MCFRPLVANNYGAGILKRVRDIFITAFGAALSVMAVGTALCIWIPQELIGMFSENVDTISAGAAALRIISAGFMVSAVSVVVCGTLEGLGFGMMSFVISLLRYVVVTLPAAWILSHVAGAVGVWHGFWIAELVTALVSVILYRFVMRKISGDSLLDSGPDMVYNKSVSHVTE